jgi:hypothetical protein
MKELIAFRSHCLEPFVRGFFSLPFLRGVTKELLTARQQAPNLTYNHPSIHAKTRPPVLRLCPNRVNSGNLIPHKAPCVLPMLHYANAKQAFPFTQPISDYEVTPPIHLGMV